MRYRVWVGLIIAVTGACTSAPPDQAAPETTTPTEPSISASGPESPSPTTLSPPSPTIMVLPTTTSPPEDDRYEVVRVAWQGGGMCAPCDQWIDLRGTRFVAAHTPVGTSNIVVTATGRLDADVYDRVVALVGDLRLAGLLGADYGCPSCPADGGALTIVVAGNGETVETRFDVSTVPDEGLEPLRDWVLGLLAEADRCAPDTAATSVTCLTEQAVAPETLMAALDDAGYDCEPQAPSADLALLPDPDDWLGSTGCEGSVLIHHWTSRHAKFLNMVNMTGAICPFIARGRPVTPEPVTSLFVHGTTWFAVAPPSRHMDLATAEDLVTAIGGEILDLDCDALAARLIERFPPPYPEYDNRNVNILSTDELRQLLAA